MKKAILGYIVLACLIFSLVRVQVASSQECLRSPDFNGDGKVDMRDISAISLIAPSFPEDPDWDPRLDMNCDNRIDIQDTTYIVNNFGITRKTQLSSFGWHSDNWSWEEKNQVYDGLIELPDIFVSRLGWAPDIPSLHESQPGKKIIIYRNLRKIDRTKTEGWADHKDERIAEYEFARRNNIICKDYRGNEVYSTSFGTDYLLADIGNPKWQQFIADWIKFYIDNYGLDGVFLDNGLSVAEDETYWGVSSKPINPRTGKYYTDGEIVRYCVQVHKKIRETIGDSELILCNGIFHGERFFERKSRYLEVLNEDLIDGFMSEGIFGSTDFWWKNGWLASVEFVGWLQDNWLDRGKIFVPHVKMHKPAIQTSLKRVWVGFEAGYSLEHSLTYHFASTLLGVEGGVFELNYFSSAAFWDKQIAEELCSLDFGEPTGPMHRRDGTNVYARTFEKGLVLVNPTQSIYQISISGSYQTLDGEIISGSYHVGSFEGVILLNVT